MLRSAIRLPLSVSLSLSRERLAEYVENEAELSGEDVGTDDEAPSSEDEYEEEDEGSDVPLSDSELWDQVNRAHM